MRVELFPFQKNAVTKVDVATKGGWKGYPGSRKGQCSKQSRKGQFCCSFLSHYKSSPKQIKYNDIILLHISNVNLFTAFFGIFSHSRHKNLTNFTHRVIMTKKDTERRAEMNSAKNNYHKLYLQES